MTNAQYLKFESPFTANVKSRSDARSPSALALLEFESPTAALLAAPVPRAARGTVWIVASFVAACFAASALIPIDSVVTAPGRVISLEPTVVVQPLETAIVRAISVHEGQSVRKGDLLGRLDSTFSGADVGSLASQVGSYGAEIDRLNAEISEQAYLPTRKDAYTTIQGAIYQERQAQYRAQIESYTQKISSLQALLGQAQDNVKAYAQRLKISIVLEGKRRELAQLQIGSQVNLLTAQDERIEMQRNLDDASATTERATRDMAQMTAERSAFQRQWKSQEIQDLNERSRKLTEAQQELSKADLRHRLVDLRAEEDAVVLTIAKVSVGSVLQSGEQFLTLVPTSAHLEIESRVDGTEAGYVHPGEHVSVKFDTFPYVHYGSAEGTVRTVSADSFSGASEDAPRGVAADKGPQTTLYYRARISVDSLKMHGVPGGFKMKPGMPVTADIKAGDRTVLMYILARILPVSREGMREP